MSQSGQGASVVVGTFPMPPGTRFDRHVHDNHQLAWASSGVLVMDTDSGSWVLPPSRALWIPQGLPHGAESAGSAVMRSLYFDPTKCPITWTDPTAVEATPLLAELIDRLAQKDLSVAARRRTEAVVFDLLEPMTVANLRTPLPSDSRALEVARQLLADPADPRSLEQWGRTVGASPRTLARAFLAETGVSFGRWRTTSRIAGALPMLAAGEPQARVGKAVGYETASAFVAAFRRETGSTPGAYFTALNKTDSALA
jgi:AraC-like DNA-binding protein/quercetin dioxygenase-like cupin family protein